MKKPFIISMIAFLAALAGAALAIAVLIKKKKAENVYEMEEDLALDMNDLEELQDAGFYTSMADEAETADTPAGEEKQEEDPLPEPGSEAL